ncbi:Gfo/Idh/MocA family protein [Paenibacillus sp. FSL K6-1230]|uniref:Gfo/Idh/MocA family protein n=1 Tax=Paenibacillus sp. FSL K6-1230 TaxID=2921603 RepID=UPI0003A6B090
MNGLVRMGVVGIGSMGIKHMKYLFENKITGCRLTAVCDHNLQVMQELSGQYGTEIKLYTNYKEMLESGELDAVLVATPHVSHPEIATYAMKCNLHVLLEKPAGIDVAEVAAMNAEAQARGIVFSMMFNQRTIPIYQQARELIRQGKLGELRRTNWVVTDWFRTQRYYDSNSWRATWRGEGGGILINQATHQLDLWQWMCGMPSRVRAFIYCGKHRMIEVEDEATIYAEYANGASGLFISSVSEYPGTNRLEIIGSEGKIVIEKDILQFTQLAQADDVFNKHEQDMFAKPQYVEQSTPVSYQKFERHQLITQNFIDAIQEGKPLIAPGEEGLCSLRIVKAAYQSASEDSWCNL